MRRLVFFILTALTYYLAGMYRTQSLLLLCVVEGILFIVSAILPHIFVKKLSVSFAESSMTTSVQGQNAFRLRIKNRGKLPAGRVRIRLTVYYEEILFRRMTVKGSGEQTEEELLVSLDTPYCGWYRIEQEQFRVYDYFGLFSVKRKQADTAHMAVFPNVSSLRLGELGKGREDERIREQFPGQKNDSQPEEFVQTREYRQGDSLRQIHWNQSARMEQLWTREYRDQTDNRFPLLLTRENWSELEEEERSAYYILLWALIQGLLCKTDEVQVYWQGQEYPMETTVSNEEDCREMLLELYRASAQEDRENTGHLRQVLSESKTSFRLDQNLRWYANERMLYHFSVTDLRQEIEEKSFTGEWI